MTERAILPPGIAPRLLSREEAAAYCGMTVRRFNAHVAKQIKPQRFGHAKLWDRKLLDKHLDRRSGLTAESVKDEEAIALQAINGIGTASLRHRAP